MVVMIPTLKCNSSALETAFRIAVGDLCGNIVDFDDGRMKSPGSVLVAGLDYSTPWTRDSAFNVWYALGLLAPQVAQNTLLSVLTRESEGVLRISGEYWDAIIWALGAWKYFLYTGDKDFVIKYAIPAIENSLAYFEAREFDPEDNLFRGGACFQDGISAYPDSLCGKGSGIIHMPPSHPELLKPIGEGIPCKALSTNCLYYWAYTICQSFRKKLELPPQSEHREKAELLKAAINQHFYVGKAGTYRYLLDAGDETIRQEGLGLAFAILSGIASKEQTQKVLDNAWISPHGIPCVWPTYERYSQGDRNRLGRHSGPIWPQVNAAWAAALVKAGRRDLAAYELQLLASKVARDLHFSELYHPFSGEIYGGMQEDGPDGNIRLWSSCRKQSWSASGLINMVLTAICGLEFDSEGVTVNPQLPKYLSEFELRNLSYRQTVINIKICANAKQIKMVRIPSDTINTVEISY